jgi:hypothetical protein
MKPKRMYTYDELLEEVKKPKTEITKIDTATLSCLKDIKDEIERAWIFQILCEGIRGNQDTKIEEFELAFVDENGLSALPDREREELVQSVVEMVKKRPSIGKLRFENIPLNEKVSKLIAQVVASDEIGEDDSKLNEEENGGKQKSLSTPQKTSQETPQEKKSDDLSDDTESDDADEEKVTGVSALVIKGNTNKNKTFFGIDDICNALLNSKVIETVVFSNVGLKGTENGLYKLLTESQVKHLDFSDNLIGTEKIGEFTSALASLCLQTENRFLTLNLSNNHINDDHLIYMVAQEAFKFTYSDEKSIDFSKNPINGSGLIAILKDSNIRHLKIRLSFENMEERQGNEILQLLRTNPNKNVVIDFSDSSTAVDKKNNQGNKLTSNTAQLIIRQLQTEQFSVKEYIEAIKNNDKHIVAVDHQILCEIEKLCEGNISKRFLKFQELCAALDENTCVEKFIVDFNALGLKDVSTEEIELISYVIKYNKFIKTLGIKNIIISNKYKRCDLSSVFDAIAKNGTIESVEFNAIYKEKEDGTRMAAIDVNEFRGLSEAFKENKSIKNIKLSQLYFSSDAEIFGIIIAGTNREVKIENLDLSGNNIDDAAVTYLLQQEKEKKWLEASNVQYFTLASNNISAGALLQLLRALATNLNLLKVRLDWQDVDGSKEKNISKIRQKSDPNGVNALNALLQVLTTFVPVQFLSPDHPKEYNDKQKKVASEIQKRCERNIMLHGVAFNDRKKFEVNFYQQGLNALSLNLAELSLIVKIIAKVIRESKSIKVVTLAELNNFASDVVGVLNFDEVFDALAESSSIEILKISRLGNIKQYIGLSGVKRLSAALEKNKTIRELDLGYLTFENNKTVLATLIHAIKINNTIQKVNLRNTLISDDAVEYLLQNECSKDGELKLGNSVQSLDISLNDVSIDNIMRLLKALINNKNLAEIYLDWSDIDGSKELDFDGSKRKKDPDGIYALNLMLEFLTKNPSAPFVIILPDLSRTKYGKKAFWEHQINSNSPVKPVKMPLKANFSPSEQKRLGVMQQIVKINTNKALNILTTRALSIPFFPGLTKQERLIFTTVNTARKFKYLSKVIPKILLFFRNIVSSHPDLNTREIENMLKGISELLNEMLYKSSIWALQKEKKIQEVADDFKKIEVDIAQFEPYPKNSNPLQEAIYQVVKNLVIDVLEGKKNYSLTEVDALLKRPLKEVVDMYSKGHVADSILKGVQF